MKEETVNNSENKTNVVSLDHYGFEIPYGGKLSFARKALRLFNYASRLSGGPTIQERHLSLMSWYLLYGISDKSRREYAAVSGVTLGYVRMMSSELAAKKYIIENTRGRIGDKKFPPEMERLSEFVRREDEAGITRAFIFCMSKKEGYIDQEHV
jgi:hypothetical protein